MKTMLVDILCVALIGVILGLAVVGLDEVLRVFG